MCAISAKLKILSAKAFHASPGWVNHFDLIKSDGAYSGYSQYFFEEDDYLYHSYQNTPV
jgi:hypothetical protein